MPKRNSHSVESFGYVKPLTLTHCPLCDRQLVAGPTIDEHHLLPKSHGGKIKFPIHRICHRKIHATFSERELAKDFSSWSALKLHPEIAAFVAWVANKPLTFYDNSRRPARRR